MIYIVGSPADPCVLSSAAALDAELDVPIRIVWTEFAHTDRLPAQHRDLAMRLGGASPLPPTCKIHVGGVQDCVARTLGDFGSDNIALVSVPTNPPPKPFQVLGLGHYDHVVVGSAMEAQVLRDASFSKEVVVDDLLSVVRSYLTASKVTAIRFILPVKDRPVELVRSLVEALRTQTKPCDEIIISDLGSSKRALAKLHHLAATTSSTLVYEKRDVWNMAVARNNGFRAPGQPFDIVCSLDVDLVPPEGFVDTIREEAVNTVIVPFARTEEGGRRFASGAAALPAEWVRRASGWDEQYEGYGSEDIDLTFRLGEGCEPGTTVYQLREDLLFDHIHHEPMEGRDEFAFRNQARFAKRMRGELGIVNPQGWGEGAKCYVERGRPRVSMRYRDLGHTPSNPAHELPPPDLDKPPEGVGF